MSKGYLGYERHLAMPRLLVVASLVVSAGLLTAGPLIGDSQQVSSLLREAKATSAQLTRDVLQMETYTRSDISWKGHASQINLIKDHINKAGKIAGQLRDARGSASKWQQDAIDRITPVLKEMASNTESIIDHINKAKHLSDPGYRTYMRSNAELATLLSRMISDFVDYDNTKERLESLETKLEVSGS